VPQRQSTLYEKAAPSFSGRHVDPPIALGFFVNLCFQDNMALLVEAVTKEGLGPVCLQAIFAPAEQDLLLNSALPVGTLVLFLFENRLHSEFFVSFLLQRRTIASSFSPVLLSLLFFHVLDARISTCRSITRVNFCSRLMKKLPTYPLSFYIFPHPI